MRSARAVPAADTGQSDHSPEPQTGRRCGMRSFEYAAPKTVKEATSLLGDKWGETEVLAGGTDLITSLKQGITTPNRVVSLKNIADLHGIKTSRNELHIGATTKLRDLIAN